MDGGCLDIWLKKELKGSSKRVLSCYENYINGFSNSFSIRLQIPDFVNKSEEKQIINAIGFEKENLIEIQ